MAITAQPEIESPLILALDIGTSSVRASVYDRNGDLLSGVESHVEYRMDLTPDGGVEVDAEVMVAMVARAIDRALMLLGKNVQKLSAVAVSTFWHSLLGVDAQGLPSTPVISWNDTRGRAAAARLRARVAEADLHARTGCRIHASYWPAKLLWLSEAHPDLVNRTQHWLSFGDYLFLRFFGELKSSISMASGTGLFNQQDCQWDEKTLELLPIESRQLPPISDIAEPARDLQTEFAGRWPVLRALPWYLPLGDGACSNVGNGCLEPTRFALMIGTSGALRAVSAANDLTIPEGLWCYRIDRRRRLLGGALSNGGNLFTWMRETLQLPDGEALEAALARLEPDGHGLTMLPLLSGERSPGWHDAATAAITGLRLATRPVEILRAGLEAIAYQFAFVYRQMEQHFGMPREVVATGGGLRHSRVWRQIIADVLGVPLRLSGVAEASSRGAALLALEAMGLITSKELGRADFAEQYVPQEENHKRYEQACARHQALYHMLIDRF